MAEYEMVRHIKNTCPNNQMRDVLFEEVETDDPEQYVKTLLRGKQIDTQSERHSDGSVTVYACNDGMTQEFIFTPV